MNSIVLFKNKYNSSFIIISNFLLLPIFFVFVIASYYENHNISNLILILASLIYSLINFILGWWILKQDNHSLIPFLGIIFGFANIVSSFYMLIPFEYPILDYTILKFFNYINPVLIALLTLFIAQYFSTLQHIKKTTAIFFLSVIITILTFIILFNNEFINSLAYDKYYYLNLINTSIIVLIYGLSIFFLWKPKKVIARPTLIYATVFFILMCANDTIAIFNPSYRLESLKAIFLVCALYILYTTQMQYFMVYSYCFLSKGQHLHFLNTKLMNLHLEFKNREIQNLQAESAIKDKLYKQLLDIAPDAFLICVDDKVVYSNQAVISLLDAENYTDILNKTIWEFIHPNSVNTAKLRRETLLEKESCRVIDELNIVTFNQEVKCVQVSSTSTYIEGHYYVISCIRDLDTIKKQKGIQLELEKTIAYEKSKVEFFANISHDLKTPINVIYSASQLQDICLHSNEIDKVHMYNRVIKQNCLRLQKLLNDVLDITKIDANHFKARPKLCNIISLIENLTQSVASYVEHKKLSIIFDTNVEEKVIITDPNLIERVILNLLSNAIKYGKKNGHIWVTLDVQHNYLSISVKDDGIGIPKDQLPQIFERFIKAQNNTTHCADGSGIGLSLVKAIVEMLGGTISCNSTENKGTEFIVILPLVLADIDPLGNYECAASFELDDTLNLELSDI